MTALENHRAANSGPAATYRWVAGPPQAGENPPHTGVWRRTIALELRGLTPGILEIGLDFELQPHRVRIDLDNLVRPAVDGLRDAGIVAPGGRDLHAIVATKRSGPSAGLGVALVWRRDGEMADPFVGRADLDLITDVIPREDRIDEKLAWRDLVAATWRHGPVSGPVGVDIVTASGGSLAGMLKPLIDGLEPYLGQEPRGSGVLRPRDELITWLGIRRVDSGAAVRVRAGPAPALAAGRTVPPIPRLPASDPDYPMGGDVTEALERWSAWRRVFEP